MLFFGIIALAADILGLPFQLYSIFVIEEKYGFNKTTLRTFFLDKVKGYFLGALIGGALLSVLIYLILALGRDFWIWFAVVASLFMLLANMFYTSLIVPLFNKLQPLPDGELKREIEKFAGKAAKLRMKPEFDGPKALNGKIVSVSDGEILFEDRTSGEIAFGYDSVAKANLKIDIGQELNRR